MRLYANLAKRPISHALLLLLLCSLTYSNIFTNQFILDDYNYIVNDQIGLSSIRSLSQMLAEPFQGAYRPVVVMVLKLFYLMFGQDPLGYHIVNLALFFLTVWLFWVFIMWIFADPRLAFFTAALFAAHPINCGPVNYCIGSVVTVFVILMQLSALAFLKYLRGQGRLYYGASLLGYLLSLLSHEMSVVLPLALILTLICTGQRSFRQSVLLCLPYGLILLIYIYMRTYIGQARGDLSALFALPISLSSYIATFGQLIFWYVSKLIYPVDILILWDSPVVTDTAVIQSLLFISLALLVVYWVVLRRYDNRKSFFAMLFLIGFLPLIPAGIVYTKVYQTIFLEAHWLTFTSIGFFGLAAHTVLSQKKLNQRTQNLILGVVIIVLSILTYQHNFNYKNEKTFCAHWLRINPADVTAMVGANRSYIQENFKGFDDMAYESAGQIERLIHAFRFFEDTEKVEKLERTLRLKREEGPTLRP